MNDLDVPKGSGDDIVAEALLELGIDRARELIGLAREEGIFSDFQAARMYHLVNSKSEQIDNAPGEWNERTETR